MITYLRTPAHTVDHRHQYLSGKKYSQLMHTTATWLVKSKRCIIMNTWYRSIESLQIVLCLSRRVYLEALYLWLVYRLSFFFYGPECGAASEKVYRCLNRNYTEINVWFQLKLPKLSAGNNFTWIDIRNRWQMNIYIPWWTIFFTSFFILNQLTSAAPKSTGPKINS